MGKHSKYLLIVTDLGEPGTHSGCQGVGAIESPGFQPGLDSSGPLGLGIGPARLGRPEGPREQSPG
jgi:hypothetical protein